MHYIAKCKTIESLEEYIGEYLHVLWLGKMFLGAVSKAWSLEEKNDELNFIKVKNYCSLKDTIKRLKRWATGWKKMCTKYISGKGFAFRIYKEHLKSTIKKWKIQ